jgi:hypothetical protein
MVGTNLILLDFPPQTTVASPGISEIEGEHALEREWERCTACPKAKTSTCWWE